MTGFSKLLIVLLLFATVVTGFKYLVSDLGLTSYDYRNMMEKHPNMFKNKCIIDFYREDNGFHIKYENGETLILKED